MSRIKSNLLWLTASQIATWTGALLLLVVVPRHIGVHDYGVYQFAVAFVGYFTLIGMLGSNTFLVKSIARDHSLVGPYVFNSILLKLVLCGLLSAFAIGLGVLLHFDSLTIVLIEVACLLMLTIVLNDALGAALQGLEELRNFALWRVLQMAAACAAVLFLLHQDQGVVAYALVTPIVSLIPLVANTINLWPRIKRSLHLDLAVWNTLIRGGAPFLIWSAILLVYGTIDIPLLKAFAGPAAVGWYALAYAWISMPASFSSVVVQATMPSLSAKGVDESSSRDFARVANRSICVVAFVGIPASIGIALVASDVFALLNYQAGFEHAIPLVQILAMHIPIVGIDMVLGSALIAVDRQRIWTLTACGAAALNILLNLFAIPLTDRLWGNGAIGAAVVTVTTEVFMMVCALALRPAGVMDRFTVSFAVRCVAASLAMIPAVLVFSSGGVFVEVAVGMVVYAVASVALGTISLKGLRSGITGRFSPALFLDTLAVPSE
jgi:O-antigen/teichoic acid export membrane protein